MPRTRVGFPSCEAKRLECITDIEFHDSDYETKVAYCKTKYDKPPACQNGGKKSRRNKNQKKGGKSKRRSNGRRKSLRKMRGGGSKIL
jgi:hypothetical protein